MRVRIDGKISSPALCVVGVWDPTVEYHLRLFRRLAKDAARRCLSSVVVTLDPAPASYFCGSAHWAIYDNLRARLECQKACGVTARAVVALTREEAAFGARWFIDELLEHIPMAELWLGANQSLGSYRPGSVPVILRHAAKRKIRVVSLPRVSTRNRAIRGRECLSRGCVRQAIRIVGRSPAWMRPNGAVWARTAWRPGRYTAAAVVADGNHTAAARKTIQVRVLVRPRGAAAFRWPASVRSLRILRGPGDT